MSHVLVVSDEVAERTRNTIKLFRKRHELTQQNLADILGISVIKLGRIENGEQSVTKTLYLAVVGAIICWDSFDAILVDRRDFMTRKTLADLTGMVTPNAIRSQILFNK